MAEASSYWLRYLNRDMILPVGRFTLGRSSACDLALDDPLVSREHAALRVRSDGVDIEDLGSRNGVLVNGSPIKSATHLEHADRITIGRHDLFLLEQSRLKRDQKTTLVETQEVGPEEMGTTETQNEVLLSALLAACERYLTSEHLEDAEAAGANFFVALRASLLRGDTPDYTVLMAAVKVGIRLADVTGSSKWLDRVFECMTLAERLLPHNLGDRLVHVAHNVGYRGGPRLDDYLMKLSELTLENPKEDQSLIARLVALRAK